MTYVAAVLILLFSSMAHAESGEELLGKPWYEKIDISGFGAAGFVRTDHDAALPHGGFGNKELSLFVEADVWSETSYFSEIQLVRLGDESTKFTRMGENYIHFKNLFPSMGDGFLGIKIGRFDIPFGEEYLWQDSIDNPLITFSAAYPYGWDEGILAYGKIFENYGWVLAVMDGTDERGSDDDPEKAVAAKVYGQPLDLLYFSFSVLKNGQSGESAIEFGGTHFEPIAADSDSDGKSKEAWLTNSPSSKVDSTVYEAALKLSFGRTGYLFANYGMASVTDDATVGSDSSKDWDRDITYYSVEPLVNFLEKILLCCPLQRRWNI